MSKDQFCAQESDVIRAARSNGWDERTRSHAASCPSCRETVNVLTALLSLESRLAEVPPTPDPRLIWLKASFARRQRRSALIARVAIFVYAVLGAALGVAVYWFAASHEIVNTTSFHTFHPSGNLAAPFLIPLFLIILLLFVFAPSGRRSHS